MNAPKHIIAIALAFSTSTTVLFADAISDAFDRLDTWIETHPNVKYKATTSDPDGEIRQTVYHTTATNGAATEVAVVVGVMPLQYEYIIGRNNVGDDVAYFASDNILVRLLTQQERTSLLAKFSSTSPVGGIQPLLDLSSQRTLVSNSSQSTTIRLDFNEQALIDNGKLPPGVDSLLMDLTIDANGAITKVVTTLNQRPAETTLQYLSFDKPTIVSGTPAYPKTQTPGSLTLAGAIQLVTQ